MSGGAGFGGLGALAAPLTAGAGVLSALGTLYEGQAASNAASYNAKVAEQNAKVERQRAQESSQDFMKRQRLALGRSRALRAASGVDLLSGSPLAADDDLIAEIALQNERILRGGEVAASRAQQEAELSRIRSKNVKTASYIGAGSTLLTAGSEFY